MLCRVEPNVRLSTRQYLKHIIQSDSFDGKHYMIYHLENRKLILGFALGTRKDKTYISFKVFKVQIQ